MYFVFDELTVASCVFISSFCDGTMQIMCFAKKEKVFVKETFLGILFLLWVYNKSHPK